MIPTAAVLRSLRLTAQRIGASGTPADVVRYMTAMQGQDLGQVTWAVGVRTGATRTAVRDAFDRGEVVRSWPMRGTLHAMHPDDLRLLLSLTADRTARQTARRAAELGIDDGVLGRARDTVTALLDGGRSADRDAVFAALRTAGVDPGAGRGYHLLLRLALEGLVAWGPTARVGSSARLRQGLVLLDQWAPAREPVPDRDEALRRVLVGYLRGRGPATVADAAAWTKLPLGDVRRARAAAGDDVEELGDGLLALASTCGGGAAVGRSSSTSATAHLLPGFDEYLLGYADRRAVLAPEHADRVVPGGNGMFLPMAVVRGRVIGTWTRTERPREVRVEVVPFEPITPSAARALERAAARYAAHVESPLSFGIR